MSRGPSPVSPEEVTGVPQSPTAGREHLQLHTNAGKGEEVRSSCGLRGWESALPCGEGRQSKAEPPAAQKSIETDGP